MATAKQTKVTLDGGDAGVREFEISHAERLLAWRGSGWTLRDENYTWDGRSLVKKAKEQPKQTKKK